ncbi:MAG: HNH endonuclease signature motif containing protein [Patescibacteria group bacterium]
MAFNSQIINQVKEKASFKCCRCQSIGIEVHHIIPQKDKGPDTFDNAAPLCPNCHSWFGDNPLKRKEITQMRDWWYNVVEKWYSTKDINYQLLNEINTKIEALTTNQDKALIDLKETLKSAAFDAIEQMTAGTARSTASGIANATVASPSPSPSFPPPDELGGSENCPHCLSGLTKSGELCPYCGDVCIVP